MRVDFILQVILISIHPATVFNLELCLFKVRVTVARDRLLTLIDYVIYHKSS